MQAALTLSQREEARDNRRLSLQHDFGRHYNGDRTDWAAVRAALKTIGQVAEYRNDTRWEALQQVLAESGEQTMAVKAHTANLQAVMSGLQSAMQALHKVFPLRNLPLGPYQQSIPHCSTSRIILRKLALPLLISLRLTTKLIKIVAMPRWKASNKI